MGWQTKVKPENLLGKILTEVRKYQEEDEEVGILFVEEGGTRYAMYHEKDCCEVVYIEDICGDLSDLVGNPILRAKGEFNHTEPDDDDSQTWSFYEFATIKGTVTIRWYGSSNGYYGETADIYEIPNDMEWDV